jgi:hypothetical protein
MMRKCIMHGRCSRRGLAAGPGRRRPKRRSERAHFAVHSTYMDQSSLLDAEELDGVAAAAAPAAETAALGRCCAVARTRRNAIAGLVGVLVLIGVLSACLVHWHTGGDDSSAGKGRPPQTNDAYAIMLDAGSSGTRAHVYRWPIGSSCPVRIAQRQVIEEGDALNIEPGLSKQEPADVAEYLKPLLDFAKGAVPLDKHAVTPIYLQATAGLRLLLKYEQQALIDAVTEAFSASPFKSDSKNSAEVVTGQVEGANEWTTVNYLRGTLGGNADTGCFEPSAAPRSNLTKAASTAAILGMGGAETSFLCAVLY